jgi:hypothetical protein
MAKHPVAAFNWSDPLLLDNNSREEVRNPGFAQDKLAPACSRYLARETDASIFRDGRANTLGMIIPEQYGGAGFNYVSYGLVRARSSESIQLPFDDERAGLARDGADQRFGTRRRTSSYRSRRRRIIAASVSRSRARIGSGGMLTARKGRRRLRAHRHEVGSATVRPDVFIIGRKTTRRDSRSSSKA